MWKYLVSCEFYDQEIILIKSLHLQIALEKYPYLLDTYGFIEGNDFWIVIH